MPRSEYPDLDAPSDSEAETRALTGSESLPLASAFEGCQFTDTQLLLPPGLPFERWQAIGETLKRIEKSVLFWVGDWLRYGERTFGETYAQTADAIGYSVGTLQNAVWVANAVDPSLRNENLTFNHHCAVAPLPPTQQAILLEQAQRENLSVSELRTVANRVKAEQTAKYAGELYQVWLTSDATGRQQMGDCTPSETEAIDRASENASRVARGMKPGGLIRLEVLRIEPTGEAATVRLISVEYPA